MPSFLYCNVCAKFGHSSALVRCLGRYDCPAKHQLYGKLFPMTHFALSYCIPTVIILLFQSTLRNTLDPVDSVLLCALVIA